MPEGSATAETPAHLRDSACYICGGSQEEHSDSGNSHAFWSNKNASEHFQREDSRTHVATTKEARYVEEWRPY